MTPINFFHIGCEFGPLYQRIIDVEQDVTALKLAIIAEPANPAHIQQRASILAATAREIVAMAQAIRCLVDDATSPPAQSAAASVDVPDADKAQHRAEQVRNSIAQAQAASAEAAR